MAWDEGIHHRETSPGENYDLMTIGLREWNSMARRRPDDNRRSTMFSSPGPGFKMISWGTSGYNRLFNHAWFESMECDAAFIYQNAGWLLS